MTQPRMLPGGYTPTAAEWATWDIGDWDPGPNRRFRARHFRRLPKPLADAAATKYRAVYDREGFRAANTFLRELGEGFGRIPIRIALSNDDLKSYARQKARACADQITRIESPGAQYQACARIMQAIGITPPDLECFTLRGALARARCEYWWRRQLRKSYLRRFEARAIEAGLVGRQAGLYASNETVRLRRAQKTRNRALLDSIIAVNELGQEYTLAELADLSVSNPRIRRGELMARLAGFERIARTQGHAGELYTLTCPSRMHARLSPRGAENPRYDGSTPRQAQEHLRRVWARMRAALHRRGVRVYGFRIAEPHHDGTPHWHLLLFMAPEHRHMVRGVMRRYALQDSPDEPGADKHRFQFVAIDWNRGSATGYLAKYISKNIDGAHVGLDEYGSDARDSAERVEAWASRWGIRQFQQIGGPPVTIWRECRRESGEHGGAAGDLVAAANDGDWGRFVTLTGGPTVERAAMPATLMKCWSDKPGQYGEPVGWCTIGVNINGAEVVTREHTWTITWAPDEGPAQERRPALINVTTGAASPIRNEAGASPLFPLTNFSPLMAGRCRPVPPLGVLSITVRSFTAPTKRTSGTSALAPHDPDRRVGVAQKRD